MWFDARIRESSNRFAHENVSMQFAFVRQFRDSLAKHDDLWMSFAQEQPVPGRVQTDQPFGIHLGGSNPFLCNTDSLPTILEWCPEVDISIYCVVFRRWY
jgi:hypothetical protein